MELIQSFCMWAWLNPVVYIPSTIIFPTSTGIFTFLLCSLSNKKDNKLIAKIILFGILMIISLTFMVLFSFSTSPLDFPGLFGPPENYYTIYNT